MCGGALNCNIAFFALEFFPLRRFLFLVLALAAQSAAADENDWRVPFITTPSDVVERMLELACTRAGDLVADLGSGDGRIVITAARKYGARAWHLGGRRTPCAHRAELPGDRGRRPAGHALRQRYFLGQISRPRAGRAHRRRGRTRLAPRPLEHLTRVHQPLGIQRALERA